MINRQDHYQQARRIAEQQIDKRGAYDLQIAEIASIDGTTGNPVLEIIGDAGAKPDRVVFGYGATLAPQAGDIVLVGKDEQGRRIIIGKIDDADNAPEITAASWAGVLWVAPGTTQLLAADTEESTTSDTYQDIKRFAVTRPGRYRLTFELSRSGGTARTRAQFFLADGSRVVCTNEGTYAGTVHPTYGAAQDLDFIETAPMNAVIQVQLLNDSAGQTAYIKNVKLKYQDALVAPALYAAVLND